MASRSGLLLCALLCAHVCGACKPPRSPRDAATGSISGEWTAVTKSAASEKDTVHWRAALEERDAGRITGSGVRSAGGASAAFRIGGVRGESTITLYFDLPDGRVKYHGGLLSEKSMPGELYLDTDTIPLVWTRH